MSIPLDGGKTTVQDEQKREYLDLNEKGSTRTQNDMGLELLMNVFGGLGVGGLNLPNTPDVPPEEIYATQLS
ncbi:hypothetical protein CsSME_00028204 [Camellia sinensis var. sinensis]